MYNVVREILTSLANGRKSQLHLEVPIDQFGIRLRALRTVLPIGLPTECE